MDKARAKRIAAELAGKFIGNWKVGKLIDNGKSALVVETESNGVKGALKIFDEDIVEACGQEVQLSRIKTETALIGKHHPHLIKILDGGFDEETGYFYIVMEFCPGETIADALKKIPSEKIKSIISQIASAAHFLEELKPPLSHRDIKPENIRIKDEYSNAVLLDLGVTKLIGDPGKTDQADKHPFIGTRRYSPPEFLRRQEKNSIEGWRAITFYQIGAVIHDILMQKPLFAGHEPETVLTEAIIGIVPEVKGTDEQQDLVRLCKSCLQKNPEIRLKLVNWSDFEFSATDTDSAFAIKNRISLTQSARVKQLSQTRSDSEIKKKIEEISGRFASLIRKECVSSGIFPPLTLTRIPITEKAVKRLLIKFPPKNGLNFLLQLFIEVSLLDIQSETVEMSYSAIGAPSAIEQFNVDWEFREFYAGNFDELLLRDPLQKFLYELYENAINIDLNEIKAEGTQIVANRKKTPKNKKL